MSGTTKQRILNAAEELMLAKGFHAVGLNEILTAVDVPKGSFYHYFPSKEQFGVELIAHYIDEHLERLSKFLSARDTTALQRFTDYWAFLIGRMTDAGCEKSCLLVKLGSEVTNFSEPMREVLADGLKRARDIYEQTIREGQADGSIRPDLDPAAAAELIQHVWTGALTRTQIEKRVAPLRSAASFLRGYLEKH